MLGSCRDIECGIADMGEALRFDAAAVDKPSTIVRQTPREF